MGAGLQTARKRSTTARAASPSRSPPHDRPRPRTLASAPEFYYEPGGGPDVRHGPVLPHGLADLFGPVKRIMGMASSRCRSERSRASRRRGRSSVQTPDHVVGTRSSRTARWARSSRASRWRTRRIRAAPIRVYGTTGTMRVPDPNDFDGPATSAGGTSRVARVPAPIPSRLRPSIGAADRAYAISLRPALSGMGEGVPRCST